MGSCISKCKPKKKFKEDCCNSSSSHVHDKLVISQDPIPPLPCPTMPASPEKPLPPASSSSSTSSSFSCSAKTKSTTALSTSSSSSSSYSYALSTKDRSFSNEFLLSCAKDNPHIIGQYPRIGDRNTDKTATCTNMIHPRRLESTSLVSSSPKVVNSFTQEKHIITAGSTPKKRASASSPTIVRQKSFRRDHQPIANPLCSVPNRGLMRSPSPSRRFNGEQSNRRSASPNGTNKNSHKRTVVYRSGVINPGSVSSLRRDSFRAAAASPSIMNHRSNVPARKMDTFSQQVVSAKIDGGISSSPDMDAVMEDVNNPHIALDCFIFL